ncbi:hypothetical protein [Gloeothece verrucosa]|uniref:Uncharacterized protein n=1 Tax=Gloeothece verrucosa (strain PCC 7822) TaxID=497965 RepID=E0U8P8_GLOV7|nr:hypothetical protein [Gloeothece verrucosa]ADN14567.1 hypothetical protein Cyan7822_2596 [Gloeothece verrucosa PCC 7822]ADN14912.1 hypothetical protein Cyan7822_2955 [Gloeothece verrucosa PCC 7822]ADN15232.1 hypothetical protein Cyan7822_3282 [Gloeothece verrucosa PCC 7822]ADN16420.1 hypothetical protein Cyan7822_4510 [Gloeothece verrucosa PCC 7822]
MNHTEQIKKDIELLTEMKKRILTIVASSKLETLHLDDIDAALEQAIVSMTSFLECKQ